MDFRNDVLPLKDKLFRLALRITLSREDAEDIVQDTLMKVWSNRAEMGAVSSIEAYAMTMCRNQALDICAKKERQNISLDEKAHDRTDTHSMLPKYSVLTPYPFRGACDICYLRKECPKANGQGGITSFELGGHTNG